MIFPDWAGYLRFRNAFAKVLDPALYTIDWLDLQIVQGAFLLWVGRDAAIIAEVKHYPTGARDIAGMLAAGDLTEIVGELIPAAEAYGQSIGCIGALIESREGWERALKPHGYARHQIALRKVF